MSNRKQGIRPETIEKGFNYFIELNNHLNNNDGSLMTRDNVRIAKKHNTSFYLIGLATRLGFYENYQLGKYRNLKAVEKSDVKTMVETYNTERAKAKAKHKHNDAVVTKLSKPTKRYKPSGFKGYITATEKYFVVNQAGEIMCKPMGIRRAKVIAQKNAESNIGKNFYLAEVKQVVGMEYIATTKDI